MKNKDAHIARSCCCFLTEWQQKGKQNEKHRKIIASRIKQLYKKQILYIPFQR